MVILLFPYRNNPASSLPAVEQDNWKYKNWDKWKSNHGNNRCPLSILIIQGGKGNQNKQGLCKNRGLHAFVLQNART